MRLRARAATDMRRQIGGEGASIPWTRPESETTAGLVVCPLTPSDIGWDATMVNEVYRLAYERARAALRPSAYELALRVCDN
jgi:hypothetical protein